MFYKYLTKQNHKSLLSIRPAGPAPDLYYFRNKVSHLLKLVSTYMYFSGPIWATVPIFSGFLSNFCCRSIVLFNILKTKLFL